MSASTSKSPEEKHISVTKFGGSRMTDQDGVMVSAFNRFLDCHDTTLSRNDANFVIIGGGPAARVAQQGIEDPAERDRAGMKVTHRHAQQMIDVLEGRGVKVLPWFPTSEAEVAQWLTELNGFNFAVCAGLRIGQSTDAVAMYLLLEYYKQLAQEQSLTFYLAVLSNVLCIYDHDPRDNPQARPIRRAGLKTLIQEGTLTTEPPKPGDHSPLDGIAVRHLLHLAALLGSNGHLLFTDANNHGDIEAFFKGNQDTILQATIVKLGDEPIEYYPTAVE